MSDSKASTAREICTICRKEYSSRAALNKHFYSQRHIAKERAVTDGRKPDTYDRFCKLCNKSFFNAQSLKKHAQSKGHQMLAAKTGQPARQDDMMAKLEQIEKEVLSKSEESEDEDFSSRTCSADERISVEEDENE